MPLIKQKYPNNEAGAGLLAEAIIASLGNLDQYTMKDPENISSIFLAGAP